MSDFVRWLLWPSGIIENVLHDLDWNTKVDEKSGEKQKIWYLLRVFAAAKVELHYTATKLHIYSQASDNNQ